MIAREFERLLAAHPGDARDVVCRQLRTNLAGRNTVAILFRDGEVIAFRDGSPLVLGLAANLVFVASDVHSFTPWATRCLVPADGEMVQIDGETLTRYDASGEVMALSWLDLPPDSGNADKAGYRHYMIKEVMESWQVVAHQMQVAGSMDVLAARACASRTTWVVGAGGAYYTSVQIAWLLREAGVAAVAVQAYEIDAMCFGLQPDDVVLAVSQSGETADTIDAVLAAKKTGAFIAALINARFSTLAQLADVVFENGSGPEICVLSTKSAVAQITFGYLLASACSGRDCDTSSAIDELSYGLSRYLTEATLRSVDQVARKIEHAEHVFVLGRQRHVGTALIAALNIKEAACIHAEAFAAGELKHGVIALIERGTPVIVFRDAGDDAMLNAAAQVAARGAVVIGAADAANTLYDAWLPLPALPRGQVAPLAAAIVPCQMLSYQLAVRRRLNPDKPRNLAKSVTVR